ncbi:MAG TPA: VCBS repeat-containing protein, partial [Flavobacteriales bacterium]|nr:VCBS repeat-containing protein [Flavobacteriales bacterium]
MKHTLPLLFVLIGTTTFAQDNCQTAVLVTAGPTYSVTYIDGVLPGLDCLGGGDNLTNAEWYRYVASADVSLTVTTDLVQNDGDDTRINIYTGTCAALTCQGGDDDSGSGYLSVATTNVQAGTTYYITFDNEWANTPFDFQLIETPIVPSPISFTPSMNASGYPLGMVDMNGDHLDDVVSPATTSVTILYQNADGTYSNGAYPTPMAVNEPSWSFCAGDIDHNGYTDMMYGGYDGASFVMAGGVDGHTYSVVNFPEYIFCQRTNMVDLENDGDLDAFSCHDVDANVYFTNDGTGTLTFHQGGLGPTCGNYGSIWVDYDNDGDQDLFIAKCGCDPVDIFLENEGGLVFPSVAETYGFDDEQQSWSSAWGDFDNDGDMDGLIGSSSGGGHKLMRNDGGSFTNITPGSGFDLFSGESIEWITYDFDNDGYLDILGGGSLLLNDHDMTFT